MPQSVISQKLGTQRNGGLSLRLCMAFLLTFTALLLSVGGLQPVYAQAPPGPAGAPPVAPEATPAPAAPAAAAPAAPSQSDISGGYAGLGAAGDVADAAGNIAPTEPTDKAAKDYADKKKTYDDFQGMMTKEPLAARMADGIGQNRIGINIMWTLVTGYLVMFMQAGFAMVESGFCRAKHAAHVFMTNFLIYPIGMLGFWLCGFAFMFGSVGAIGNLGLGADVLNGGNSFIGWKGFMLGLGPGGIAPELYNPAVYTLFLFQMVFMDTTCTIPTGAMAERWKFSAFIIYGFFISTIIYPIYGHWVWGGGWLSALGTNYGLGHGAVDFAGSGVVHAVGGWVALAGAMVLGPRLGKYTADGKPRALPGHNIPMALIGTFILAFGWFGFNPGSTLGASGGGNLRIGIVATNTMLASAGGAIAAMLYWAKKSGYPDPGMVANGFLAGLVAITAPCAFTNSGWSVVIGIIAGILVCLSISFWENLGVDDPVGAISVHGVCGVWGVLAVGIFSDGTYGKGWNLTSGDWAANHGVTGALYGNISQLWAQGIDAIVVIAWSFLIGYGFFKVQHAVMGIRSRKEDELQGLDIPEMGVLAYHTDDMLQT